LSKSLRTDYPTIGYPSSRQSHQKLQEGQTGQLSCVTRRSTTLFMSMSFSNDRTLLRHIKLSRAVQWKTCGCEFLCFTASICLYLALNSLTQSNQLPRPHTKANVCFRILQTDNHYRGDVFLTFRITRNHHRTQDDLASEINASMRRYQPIDAPGPTLIALHFPYISDP
jgi:hypothetical protein